MKSRLTWYSTSSATQLPIPDIKFCKQIKQMDVIINTVKEQWNISNDM